MDGTYAWATTILVSLSDTRHVDHFANCGASAVDKENGEFGFVLRSLKASLRKVEEGQYQLAVDILASLMDEASACFDCPGGPYYGYN